LAYTEKQRDGLLKFVTSADDYVFAVKNLPPELVGAFFSFTSRTSKDFRDNLLAAITGAIPGYEGEDNLALLVERLEPLHRAVESGLLKARSFYEEVYGRIGHRSVGNLVWIPFFANGVSQLVAKTLAYEQLAFFIEKSTRYVKFKDYYKDPDVEASEEHAKKYNEAVRGMLDTYRSLLEVGVERLKEEIPFEEWVKEQHPLASEELLEKKYNRELRGAALDVARYVLPQAVKTQVGFIIDARSLERDISVWKTHPLEEVRVFAEKLEEHGRMIAPSLLKYTEPNAYYSYQCNYYRPGSAGSPLRKCVEVLSKEDHALEKLVSYLFHEQGKKPYEDVAGEVKAMSFKDKITVLKQQLAGREAHDESLGIEEAFNLVRLTLRVTTDLGAVRDLRRHQKAERSEGLYTLRNGFYKPRQVTEWGVEAEELFDRAMNLAGEAELALEERFPFQAQYLVPMAAFETLIFNLGLDEWQYVVGLRSKPEGHFSYRQDAWNMAEAGVKAYPWTLGYEEYPAGKDFRTVYEEAPLKSFLKVNLEGTGLHT